MHCRQDYSGTLSGLVYIEYHALGDAAVQGARLQHRVPEARTTMMRMIRHLSWLIGIAATLLLCQSAARANNPFLEPFNTPRVEFFFADCNADGHADVIKRDVFSGFVYVHFFDGAGFNPLPDIFANSYWQTVPSDGSWHVFFADINGDRRADLINLQVSDGLFGVKYNHGTAFSVFDDVTVSGVGPGGAQYRRAFADVTGDGLADLIVTDPSTGDVSVYPRSGSAFSSSPVVSARLAAIPFSEWDQQVVDMNNDGAADYVNIKTHPWGFNLTGVHTANGTGGFSQFDTFQLDGPTEIFETQYTIADVSNDGVGDFIQHNLRTGEVQAFRTLTAPSGARQRNALADFVARTEKYARPSNNKDLPVSDNRALDAVMFYIMDWLPGVNQRQIPSDCDGLGNGPPGPEDGWWPRNPNYPGVVPNSCTRYRTIDPLLGTYASNDPNVIRQHAYWLASMGITAIAIDWTNVGKPLLDPYSQALMDATEVVLATYAQITSFVPPKVFVVMRWDYYHYFDKNPGGYCDINFNTSVANSIAQRAYALSQWYPSVWYKFKDEYPNSAADDDPLLVVFEPNNPVPQVPAKPTDPHCPVSGPNFRGTVPLWTPTQPFKVRYSNGSLVGTGVTTPIPAGQPGYPGLTFIDHQPYWNQWEPSTGHKDEFVPLYATMPSGRLEHAEIHTTMYYGNGKPPPNEADWIGQFTLVRLDSGEIFDTVMERFAAPLLEAPPLIVQLNGFNYALGWGSIPGEGVSTNASIMLEPTEPLPDRDDPTVCPVRDDCPFPVDIAGDSSYYLFDKAGTLVHQLRQRSQRRPGRPIILSCDAGVVAFSSENMPTRYRLSNNPSGSVPWHYVNINDQTTTTSGARVFQARLPEGTVCSDTNLFIQTRNAFGTTDWFSKAK
jgi:hypothetical protein